MSVTKKNHYPGGRMNCGRWDGGERPGGRLWAQGRLFGVVEGIPPVVHPPSAAEATAPVGPAMAGRRLAARMGGPRRVAGAAAAATVATPRRGAGRDGRPSKGGKGGCRAHSPARGSHRSDSSGSECWLAARVGGYRRGRGRTGKGRRGRGPHRLLASALPAGRVAAAARAGWAGGGTTGMEAHDMRGDGGTR